MNGCRSCDNFKCNSWTFNMIQELNLKNVDKLCQNFKEYEFIKAKEMEVENGKSNN